MNTASVDIDQAILSVTSLIEIIEDLGFDASLIEIESDVSNPMNNPVPSRTGEQFLEDSGEYTEERSLRKDSFVESNHFRKVMLQLDEADNVRLASKGEEPSLEALRNFIGVTSASYSPKEKDSDNAHFNLTIDESIIGPRALVNMLEREFNLHATVASLGGFMMAGRLLKMHQKEQSKQGYKLLAASCFTLPILVITMILPSYQAANAILDTLIMKGLNIYGVALLVLCTPVQWVVGWSFHAKAMKTIASRSLGMDFLISSGTTAAYVFSIFGMIQGIYSGVARDEDVEFFETAAVLITVVIFGKYLECYAKGKTAAAIHRLSSLRATHARLVRSDISIINSLFASPLGSPVKKTRGTGGGSGLGEEGGESLYSMSEMTEINMGSMSNESTGSGIGSIGSPGGGGDTLIDASLLQRGDVLRLVEGESVPSDGTLLSSRVGIDESMLTGTR